MRLAVRASLFDFRTDPSWTSDALRYVEDGLVVVEQGVIEASGDYAGLRHLVDARTKMLDYSGCLVTPGFVDTHIHLPQVDVIASPAPGLLQWLERYTFPAEARFSDPAIAAETARFFMDELTRHGTTSALVFGTVHAGSVEALFEEALRRNVRLAAGKCLMDRHCPPALRDTAESGVRESADLARRWHGRGRLAYAITPRFAATSTPRQLELAGELARGHPELIVQSHVAESVDEVRWVKELYPDARSYLDVYDRVGLLRERSVYAHCIWLDGEDRRRMHESGAAAAVCPTSNLFLGSGLFDFRAALDAQMSLTLATDVGGGQSFSMFATMRAAHEVARLNGESLSALQLWYWASRSGAVALGWQDFLGRLEPGFEADFVMLDPRATPLLARRTARVQSFEEIMFALIVLGDDRVVRETFIAGRPSKAGPEQIDDA
jgi:guanine deaminase